MVLPALLAASQLAGYRARSSWHPNVTGLYRATVQWRRLCGRLTQIAGVVLRDDGHAQAREARANLAGRRDAPDLECETTWLDCYR
jgi:hypothetical protein